MRMFFASFILRFHETDALLAALNVLERVDPSVIDTPDDVRKAKLKIAHELIRRKVVFW